MTALDTPPTPTTTETTPAILARNVTKTFAFDRQQVTILHGVDVTVQTGEMVAIMGPSGSGKSTLLYCLAGLESVTDGTIQLNDQPLTSLSRAALAKLRRSEVGFVFQAYNLVPTLSAFENVALPYRLRGQKAPSEVITQTLTKVGLAERIHAMPPSMSGGEQQRVALARVIAQQPRIVFADEPTGALDSRTGEQVMAELHRISRSPRQAVLLVTHDPGVAARCDRVLYLKDGRIVEAGRGQDADAVAATLAHLAARSGTDQSGTEVGAAA